MAQQLPLADIFTKISDSSEKARLYQDLSDARGEIHAKMPEPSSDVFVLMASHFNGDRLTCKITGANSPSSPSGTMILTFFVGGEKYFLQTTFQYQGDQVYLAVTEPLFHLQRREDYRIRIPPGYKALFEAVSINGKTRKIAIPVTDLSGGGCRIQVDPQVLMLKTHDELKGHLFIPDRSHIQVTGSVRHVRGENTGVPSLLTCGIQFVGLTEPLKNKIIAVVMDLYRVHFAGRA